jgi:hypothetical protein
METNFRKHLRNVEISYWQQNDTSRNQLLTGKYCTGSPIQWLFFRSPCQLTILVIWSIRYWSYNETEHWPEEAPG